jgi:hypothetical protein
MKRLTPQLTLIIAAVTVGIGDLVFIVVTGDIGWGWILLVVTAVTIWSSSDAFHRRRD